MPLPSVSKLISEDDVLNRVQDRIKVFADVVASIPLLEGRLLTVTLAAGAFTPVSHGLGRRPTGYLVVRRNANAVLWDQADAADANAFLYLQPSATVTVTLWVF
mgnify:FL=1|jgi:hypothetical protein